MNSQTRLKYLYERYLDLSATDAEVSELMAMIADGVHDEELNSLADAAWERLDETHVLKTAKADDLFAAITQTEPAQKTAGKVMPMRWIGWAAAAAILIVGTFTLLKHPAKRVQKQDALLVQRHSNTEHQLVKLADGSRVVLNKNSYLRYPAKFGASRREVTLVGEGYFDIKHDASHPFIVHAGQIDVTVLGTAFNVHAYSSDKLLTVTVTRGKVSVSKANQVLGVLTPNEQIAFNQTDEQAMHNTVDANQAVQWQQKDIFFENITMQDAIADLEERFKVKVVFANEAVKNCRFTATFLHGEKLTDILQVICDFNNATYKTTDDGKIVISGPGCS